MVDLAQVRPAHRLVYSTPVRIPTVRCWFVLALVAPATGTFAQAGDSRAARFYEEGLASFEGGDFEAARASFAASHAVLPSPNSKLMLGRALAGLGQRAAAAQAFVTARQSAAARAREAPRYAATAAAAERHLSALSPLLGRVVVQLQDASAEVTVRVNQISVETAELGQPSFVEPGVVSIRVEDQGRALDRSVTVAAGDIVVVRVNAGRSSGEVQTTTDSPPEPEGNAAPEPLRRESPLRPLGRGLLGAGIAATLLGAAGFGAFGALARARHNELADACGPAPCPIELRSDVMQGIRYRRAANGFVAVGVVGLVLAATGIVVRVSARGTSIALELGPRSARLVARFP